MTTEAFVAYRVITLNDRDEFNVDAFTAIHPDDFEARGYKVTGTEKRASLRSELRFQPKLEGFCGPMWGGDHIRYEAIPAYKALSQ